MRPTFRFLLHHPAHLLACGLGSGLSPWAPGTAGTLAAWAMYPLLRAPLSDTAFGLLLLACFVVGILAIQRTGQALGEVDHGAIVWDEMVPFWFVLWLTPPGLAWQVLAFALFRLFDITKPHPAKWVDEHMKTGLGVMLDDTIAAGYTLFCLAAAHHVLG